MKLVRTSHFIGFIGSWWNKRTQLNSFPGLFAAARNREFLWRLQIGRHYRSFFRGFGLLFCVHLLRHSGSIYRGFFQVSFVFFELVTWLDFTLITFDKKGNAVPVQTGVRFFGFSSENKLHHRKARRYETICFFDRSRYLVCTSIDSGPCVACLVRMRDDVLLLHNWDNNFYSVHEHDFVSLRHSCRWINRGNRSHISLAIFWLQLLTSIVLVAANGSVCMHRCKSTLKPKPTSQYLPMYLPSSNLDPRVSLLCPPWSLKLPTTKGGREQRPWERGWPSSCTGFLPGLGGQLISETNPRRTPRTTWPETNNWIEAKSISFPEPSLRFRPNMEA